jgi:hypothetical protein
MTKYKFYNFYFRLNCDQSEVLFYALFVKYIKYIKYYQFWRYFEFSFIFPLFF